MADKSSQTPFQLANQEVDVPITSSGLSIYLAVNNKRRDQESYNHAKELKSRLSTWSMNFNDSWRIDGDGKQIMAHAM